MHYGINGNLKLRQVSEFDNFGNKIGYVNFNAEGLKGSYGKYTLDNKGRITGKYHNGEEQET
jgi:hypothetical protein